MRYTKREFSENGYLTPIICENHANHPDQEAITSSCPDCVYVEDDCGCGLDEECEDCEK